MASAIIGMVTALAGLAALFMEWYMANSPERKKEQENEDRQDFRNAVENHDTAAVESTLDGLLSPTDSGITGCENGRTEKE